MQRTNSKFLYYLCTLGIFDLSADVGSSDYSTTHPYPYYGRIGSRGTVEHEKFLKWIWILCSLALWIYYIYNPEQENKRYIWICSPLCCLKVKMNVWLIYCNQTCMKYYKYSDRGHQFIKGLAIFFSNSVPWTFCNLCHVCGLLPFSIIFPLSKKKQVLKKIFPNSTNLDKLLSRFIVLDPDYSIYRV